eukprot:scaffold76960_cov21-Tisochrysis_lutea.AAC.1
MDATFQQECIGYLHLCRMASKKGYSASVRGVHPMSRTSCKDNIKHSMATTHFAQNMFSPPCSVNKVVQRLCFDERLLIGMEKSPYYLCATALYPVDLDMLAME